MRAKPQRAIVINSTENNDTQRKEAIGGGIATTDDTTLARATQITRQNGTCHTARNANV